MHFAMHAALNLFLSMDIYIWAYIWCPKIPRVVPRERVASCTLQVHVLLVRLMRSLMFIPDSVHLRWTDITCSVGQSKYSSSNLIESNILLVNGLNSFYLVQCHVNLNICSALFVDDMNLLSSDNGTVSSLI